MRDIIVTIPATIKWDEYKKELDRAAKGEILNFKVNHFPKTEKGCKCYILHRGYIRGYMFISGLSTKKFTCTTTGKVWAGKFIERTGKYYPLIRPISMTGFQGFRYFGKESSNE